MSPQTSPQTDVDLQKTLEGRFKELPKIVRDAIRSADVEKRLRELANTHKLHVDQWQKMENEVMLALLGFEPVEDLQQNIKNELVVSDEIAGALAADVSRIVFEPIRQELERELEHPEAKEKEVSGIEAARTQVLAGSQQTANSEQRTEVPTGTLPSKPVELAPIAAPVSQAQSVQPAAPQPPPLPVAPATPPPPPPTAKAIRAPASGAYKSGEASAVRKDVHDDPYREPPA